MGALMRAILLPLVLAGWLPQAVMAEDCTPVRFDPGTSSAVIGDLAPAEGVRCFSLSVRPGQRAHVGIVEGDAGVAVTVSDVADNRRSVDFVTEAERYELYVHQTFRAPSPVPFRLLVQVQ